ncbi:hypothetical protein V498_03193 [Pseudogymnoascus sp. VKM F-4517 (FW-2822)]|nr:hypothetical protein V498_03193 [Pseudogymnoascus sp. VKM F-4517 (FW-2822)]
MSRVLPEIGDLVGFDHAVAGHDGTLTDPAGELFVKPCTATEIAFYEYTAAHHPAFADLMPTFLGTLALSESQTAILDESSATTLPKSSTPPAHAEQFVLHHKFIKTKRIVTDRALVLENATHGFRRPNILDVKLGVRLWADDAPAEKRARFDKITAETTHASHGFRVAGMRVWQGDDAPRGGHVDADGYKIYDKNYGREEIGVDNVADAFREFIGAGREAGVDEELGRLVAQAFLAEVEEARRVLESVETRMYSSSLLFIYEGDGKALREAMEEATRVGQRAATNGKAEAATNGEAVPTMNGVGIEELINGDGDADEDEDEDEEVLPKIYSVKLIDFAHAEFVPGQGSDENSLRGIRSVAEILRSIGEEEEGKKQKNTA